MRMVNGYGIRLFALLVMVALAFTGVTAIATGSGVAQANNTTDPAAPDPDPQPDPEIEETDNGELSDREDPTTVYADVDSSIRIMSWQYDEETEMFTIEIENTGNSRTQISIMEIIDLDDDREGALGFRELSVRGGESVVVEISAQLDSGSAGVIVMTQESIDNGQVQPIIYDDGGVSWVDGDATWTDVQIGVIVGIVTTILGTLIVAWHVVARQSADYEEVEIVS